MSVVCVLFVCLVCDVVPAYAVVPLHPRRYLGNASLRHFPWLVTKELLSYPDCENCRELELQSRSDHSPILVIQLSHFFRRGWCILFRCRNFGKVVAHVHHPLDLSFPPKRALIFLSLPKRPPLPISSFQRDFRSCCGNLIWPCQRILLIFLRSDTLAGAVKSGLIRAWACKVF